MTGDFSLHPSERAGHVGRIGAIDALRGLSIILMVAYHFGYDLVLFDLVPVGTLYNPLLNTLEPFFAGLFITLCGVSTYFSRSNLKRGLLILLCAVPVTVATYLLDPDFFILFGILHCLGCCVLLYCLLRPLLDRLPDGIKLSLYLAGLAASFFIRRIPVKTDALLMFGLASPEFDPADYFPLLPWFFIFLLGTWVGKYIFERRFPDWFYTFRCRPLEFFGRHTLLIYLAHQPVCYGIVMGIAYSMGKL